MMLYSTSVTRYLDCIVLIVTATKKLHAANLMPHDDGMARLSTAIAQLSTAKNPRRLLVEINFDFVLTSVTTNLAIFSTFLAFSPLPRTPGLQIDVCG